MERKRVFSAFMSSSNILNICYKWKYINFSYVSISLPRKFVQHSSLQLKNANRKVYPTSSYKKKKIPVIPFVLQFKVLTEGNKKMETFRDEYKQVKRKKKNCFCKITECHSRWSFKVKIFHSHQLCPESKIL